MSKKFKLLSLLLASVLALAVFTACGNDADSSEGNGTNDNDQASGDEDVELRFMWWGNQDRHDRTLAAIELFEEQNQNITISYEFLNFDDFSERLATQSAAGNAPDVFQMVDRWLPQYTNSNLLADLQPYVDSGVINTDNIDQSALNPGYIGDQLVGFNAGSNAFALVYDPAMFDEAGVDYPEAGYTWEEYFEMGRQVQEALGLEYGLRNDVQHDRHLGVILRQNGQWLYNEDGTASGMEDDSLFLDMINTWNELEADGVTPPADVLEATGSIENYQIVTGDAPMQIIHSNQIVAVTSAANREFELTILPSGEDGTSGQWVRASLFYAMNANTEHPDEVAKFIDFLTNDLDANDIMQGDRGVPISSEVRDHLYDTAERTIQQQFEYIDLISEHAEAAPPPPPPTGQEMDRFFEDVWYEVLYGVSDAESALEKYKDGLEDIIAR
ncbi:extracellular solute-binding protein [Evansella sp. AB-P1]|uniref:ABC transporter substrate-binding protein n=1 Tax=Evansella sp. AB-P1 TaxID=3037653 RepID=UPI00241F289D|nr:extracellular solute-binding protein [Evansella sp. AB-P1]MDG5786914.1 extracellular solute-binding protein [Evansella sp. AB-P1]